MKQALFGDVLLLSDCRPSGLPDEIRWRQIRPLKSRLDYSEFMLRELADHIGTSHALCVQWDGFVLRGSAWRSEFLDYDYIGAIWPHFKDGHNVGNGGFSLRSKRLLEACKELPFDGSHLEDVVICRLNRERLEADGIRFAPESLARRFAFERAPPDGHEFGFHGVFNLVRQLTPSDALRTVRSLEPGMLARSERLELLRWGLGRAHMQFALEIAKRLI
jgi:hypothetical protein